MTNTNLGVSVMPTEAHKLQVQTTLTKYGLWNESEYKLWSLILSA